MITDLSTGASHEPVASCSTAFACLLRLSSQVRSDGEGGAVCCRGVVDGDSLPLSRLVEFAGELGIEAENARLDWQSLQTIGFKNSILALLKNTNLVVLTGAGGGGDEAVAVWDPLDRYDRVHFVPRQKFEAVWTGDVVIITKQLLQKSEAPKTADFCWFTPAGLQLLGKTSGDRQRHKLLHRASESPGAQYPAGAPNARQQAVSAPASDSSGEPTATAGIVIKQPSQPPVEAITGRGEGRRVWPVIRFYFAATAVLAIAATGVFLIKNPAADKFLIATTAATEAPGEAPISGSSIDRGTTRDADRLPQSAPRLGLAHAVFSPPRGPNTVPTEPSSMEGGLHQAAVRVGRALGISGASRSVTEPLVASAAAGLPPEAEKSAPELPGRLAVEAGGIPSGSTAESNSGSTTASLAAPRLPAAASAPAGANLQETSKIPTTAPAPAPAAADPVPSAAQSPIGSIPETTSTTPDPDPVAAATDGPGPSTQDSSTPRTISTSAPAAQATPSQESVPNIAAANRDAVASAAPAATTVSTVAMPDPAEPPVERRFSEAEIATFLGRGDAFLSSGDIASARLFYERAADAGAGLAAVRLGETFDPAFLDRAHFRGARGDPGRALSWYRRARDLGFSKAEVLLKALENN